MSYANGSNSVLFKYQLPFLYKFCILISIFVQGLSKRYTMVYVRVLPGRVAKLVTYLATDASLIADPGVASSIPARSHTFVEIYREIISTVILLPSTESFKKNCCQLQAKVCARRTG